MAKKLEQSFFRRDGQIGKGAKAMKKMTEQEFCQRCNEIDHENDTSGVLLGHLICAISGAFVVGLIWLLVEVWVK